MKHSFISVWVMMRSLEGGLGANFDPLFYLGNGSHAFDQLLHMRCCFQKIWRSLDVKVEKVHERQIRPCQRFSDQVLTSVLGKMLLDAIDVGNDLFSEECSVHLDLLGLVSF